MIRVLIIVTGSIAIKKLEEFIKLLKNETITIDIIATKSALSLIKSLNIKNIKNCKIYTDKDFFNKNNKMLHIELSRKADAVLVYPASANIIGKFSNGIADDFATSTLMACNKQIFIAPAMNTEMWSNIKNLGNIDKLKKIGVIFIGPDYGNLACGEVGRGRISESNIIIGELLFFLKSKKTLNGLTGIITSGPTIEPIDSIRYISNYSSGKQGYAIAKIFAMMGANIKLISGPTDLDNPLGVKLINVKNAKEMNSAVMDLLPADFAVCAAAVADFKPSKYKINKIDKNKFNTIKLRTNTDILYNISNSKNKRPELVIGFAAETNNLKRNAMNKLINKKCDWILANKISKKNLVFGSEENKISYITKNLYESWPKMSKIEVAKKLNLKVSNFFEKNVKNN